MKVIGEGVGEGTERLIEDSIVREAGNGSSTLFWRYSWLEGGALKVGSVTYLF